MKPFSQFLSVYSLGTSSADVSRVRTSPWSGSSAFSTPLTTSASYDCPSSASSSTLSESTSSLLDNPCTSPDCPADPAPVPLLTRCGPLVAKIGPPKVDRSAPRISFATGTGEALFTPRGGFFPSVFLLGAVLPRTLIFVLAAAFLELGFLFG